MEAKKTARFDTKLTEDQKTFFEYAASLGGYRTFTEFILTSVQKEAERIVEKHQQILASKKDQEIFFDALLNPSKPNETLKKAMQKFNKEFDQ